MKIFVAMPHYFSNERTTLEQCQEYASCTRMPMERAKYFYASVKSYTTLFQRRNIELSHSTGVIGTSARRSFSGNNITISICTTGENHLIDFLPKPLPLHIKHIQVDCDPQHLGFACHRLMAEAYHQGDYQYFVYSEDDIAITDANAFNKISWFSETFGERCILQPNRYEIPENWSKVYIDGELHSSLTKRFFDTTEDYILTGKYNNDPVNFIRHRNPLSGCFFLTRRQMEIFLQEPNFGIPDAALISYLESAQILPLLRPFRIYKPQLNNAAFFEVHHTDTRLSRTPSSTRTLNKALAEFYS